MMPRTITPSGTACAMSNLLRNHLEEGLSKKLLESVDKLTTTSIGTSIGVSAGLPHEYTMGNASLPPRWKST